MSTLADAVASAEVLVCCGSGGVGKTTTAAAIGMHAARLGRRAVVVTIDPAKRLADALGVPGGLTNDPVRIPVDEPGELWALMLDTATTFDGLVTANAATPQQAQRILDNPFYRNIAGSFSGTQDYMAAERLHALHGDERFDVVIVDTPPTRNALDFLDAPGVITRFLDHPLFKVLMMPTRRGLKVLNIAAQPVLRTDRQGRRRRGARRCDRVLPGVRRDGDRVPPARRRRARAAAQRRHPVRAGRLAAGRHDRRGALLRQPARSRRTCR